MLLNEAAHNVSIRNLKVSKPERNNTYSVTKHTYVLWRCTLCDVYVLKTLHFGTLALCAPTFCNNYVMWRLRYVALRYAATFKYCWIVFAINSITTILCAAFSLTLYPLLSKLPVCQFAFPPTHSEEGPADDFDDTKKAWSSLLILVPWGRATDASNIVRF